MASSYKLKNTDNLASYGVPTTYIPVSHSVAAELMAEGREVYALYFDPVANECTTSVRIQNFTNEEDTQLFTKRLVDPARLTEYYKLKQKIEQCEYLINSIEDDFLKDAALAGHDITVSCPNGSMFTYEKAKVTCTKPLFIQELFGKDSGITPKPVAYDVPKSLHTLATAIFDDALSEFQSVEEFLEAKYADKFKDASEIKDFIKRLRKTDKANHNLFMNKLELSNDEAAQCVVEIKKINDTVELNKWYRTSKYEGTFEQFKADILDGFQFQNITTISTKMV